MLVWGFRADRNASATARLLSGEEYADLGLAGVPRQTILEWSNQHNWAGLIDKELYDQAPNLRYRAQSELALGAPEAARFLRETLTIGGGQLTKEDIALLKVKSENARHILDRTGFSPVGTRDVGHLDTPPESDSFNPEDVDWNDPDQVKQYEDWTYRTAGVGRRSVEAGKARTPVSLS